MNIWLKFLFSYVGTILLGSSFVLEAQKNNSLEPLVKSLNQALVERDEISLEALLHHDLSYGHSNGWVENKKELLENNRTEYVLYEQIEIDSFREVRNNNISIVRFESTTKLKLEGKSLNLKLHVCQTWLKVKGRWKLLARQSTKLG